MVSPDDWEWTCACCGGRKRGLPDLAFQGPLCWTHGADDPIVTILEKTDDTCVAEIDGTRFTYVRCVLPVSVQGMAGLDIGFGAWSTLSGPNFARYADTFLDTDQSKLGQMFGYLGNALPGYPDTENLPLNVRPRDDRQRPLVFVQDTHADHPLFVDQQQGIAERKLVDIL